MNIGNFFTIKTGMSLKETNSDLIKKNYLFVYFQLHGI